jgi:uncharacterized membrane protein (DUF2068 family)
LLSSQMRPLGVTIIAILVALGGVLGIIFALAALAAAPALAIYGLIIGVLYLVLAWGLWTLKPWAFWTTVIFEAIGLIGAIIGLVQRQGTSVVSLIFPIVVLVYMLMDRNVRAAFRT